HSSLFGRRLVPGLRLVAVTDRGGVAAVHRLVDALGAVEFALLLADDLLTGNDVHPGPQAARGALALDGAADLRARPPCPLLAEGQRVVAGGERDGAALPVLHALVLRGSRPEARGAQQRLAELVHDLHLRVGRTVWLPAGAGGQEQKGEHDSHGQYSARLLSVSKTSTLQMRTRPSSNRRPSCSQRNRASSS